MNMQEFWIVFVPLFVAVDAIGVLPLFVALTADYDPKKLLRLIFQSIVTASFVTLGFLFFGQNILRFLGVTVHDFMIGGGILLLTISLGDLLTGEKSQRQADQETIGAVPIGVPLIAGPAVLTTTIVLANQNGQMVTAVAVLANVLIAGIVFMFSRPITKLLGRNGTRIISKVTSLLLTAIAVMLIRKGIMAFIV